MNDRSSEKAALPAGRVLIARQAAWGRYTSVVVQLKHGPAGCLLAKMAAGFELGNIFAVNDLQQMALLFYRNRWFIEPNGQFSKSAVNH